MNTFEIDLKRSIVSMKFIVAILLYIVILLLFGPKSDAFKIAITVIATIPYTTALIDDYESGYLKFYLGRTTKNWYILGKFLSCGISGGLAGVIGVYVYSLSPIAKEMKVTYLLLFIYGMFWSLVSATISLISNSSYVAYGGGFISCYMLVLLYKRYFNNIYCLYPYEWLKPKHKWILDNNGVIVLISGITIMLFIIYYEKARRYIENV